MIVLHQGLMSHNRTLFTFSTPQLFIVSINLTVTALGELPYYP